MKQGNAQSIATVRRLGGATPPPPVTLLTSLMGYYNLDEALEEEDAIDSVGSMGNLFVWGDNAPAFAGPGSHGARSVDNTGFKGFVDFEAFSNTPCSFNFWIYQTGAFGQYPFDATNGSNGISCFLAMDGEYVNMHAFPFGTYESPGIIGTMTYVDNGWTMITLVWDGTNYAYYQDDVLVSSDAFNLSGPFVIGIAPFQISVDFLPVQGAMALFGVWARALTGAEVTALYNSGNGKNYSELV